MRHLIWNFIKFLWKRNSLNAFTVIVWIDRYLTPKDTYDVGVYLKRAGEDKLARKQWQPLVK